MTDSPVIRTGKREVAFAEESGVTQDYEGSSTGVRHGVCPI